MTLASAQAAGLTPSQATSLTPSQAMIRFGLGGRPDQKPPTDPRAWLLGQLDGPDPALATPSFAGLPSGAAALAALRDDRMTRKRLARQGLSLKDHFKPRSREMFRVDAAAQLGWALRTNAPFRERLVWFWANHFTVSMRQGGTAALIGPFLREAIRPHVTGRFTDMVLAVERHPAMLLYLGNAGSVGPDSRAGVRRHRGLNENLGRECMELHTVSLRAGYSQQDVIAMAKLLTGWSVDPRAEPTGFRFRPFAHEPGPQTLMGRSFPPGEAGGIAALRFLSTYHTTWTALATKLVRHFVADQPPAAAVAHVAGVLAGTQGDLRAASAALVDLPQAWSPGRKIKTPVEYFLSVGRALGETEAKVPAALGMLRRLGQPLWAAPLPDGWSDLGGDWSGPDAVLARIDFAYTMAGRSHDRAPAAIATAALGAQLRPETLAAVSTAGSPREALALLFASPEFLRR